MQNESGSSGLPAAVPIVSADPQAFQITVQLKVADLNASGAFLDVDEGNIRHGPVGQVELFEITERPARAWLEASVAKSARATERCTPAFDPDRPIAAGEMNDVRRGERGPVAASGRTLVPHDIYGRPKNDCSAAGSIQMRRHRRECSRVVGPAVAFRTEHFGGNRTGCSSPHRQRKAGGSHSNDELTSRRYHRWTFSHSM